MRCRTAFALAASLAAGCAASGYERSQDVADAMRAAVAAAESFGRARQAAFDAMNALAEEPLENLPAKFKTFSASVDGVTGAESYFRSSVVDAKTSAGRRFQAWEREDATYSNPSIQARSQQRRAEARGAVDKAGADADAMLEQAAGFVSYLSDLRKLLSNDLTPKGVAGIADLARNARAANGRLDQMARPTIASLGAAAEALGTK